ncbi:MAG TPA: PilZ domain-containing protein [Pseudomonadales bacterium]|nr:PilZ domain-containing protein [Pseudomonadales bacterium]
MDNKRNYFRVQIPIGLRIVNVGNDIPPVPASSHFEESATAELKRKLQGLRQTVNQHLRDIPTEFDAICLALHNIQLQVDVLAAAHLKEHDTYHRLKVSLSEGGIGWRQREPLKLKHFIALKLELDELNNHCFYGKVMSCEHENDFYHIGVAFQDLEEHELQSIAKFVLQTDAEQRRLRRTMS